MLFQKRGQFATAEVLGRAEFDPQHVHAGLLASDPGHERQIDKYTKER